MKKILSLLILGFIGTCFLLPIFSFESCANEQMTTYEVEDEYIEPEEVNIRELSIIYANKELESIEHLKETDRLEWYKSYKNIMCKYRYIIDPPLSVFNVYTEDEIRLICRVIETECYGQNFDSKVMVANVIYNRLENSKYSSDVTEVVTSPNQFAYWRETISEDTLFAAMFGYEMGDLTNGSLSFHSNEKTDTFYGRKYVFTDEASGHHFYK